MNEEGPSPSSLNGGEEGRTVGQGTEGVNEVFTDEESAVKEGLASTNPLFRIGMVLLDYYYYYNAIPLAFCMRCLYPI